MTKTCYWFVVSMVAMAVLLWLAILAGAQTVPTLTEVQRLTVQNRVLAFQLAQAQLEKARSEIEATLKELQQPGYDLDLGTLAYTPKKIEKP